MFNSIYWDHKTSQYRAVSSRNARIALLKYTNLEAPQTSKVIEELRKSIMKLSFLFPNSVIFKRFHAPWRYFLLTSKRTIHIIPVINYSHIHIAWKRFHFHKWLKTAGLSFIACHYTLLSSSDVKHFLPAFDIASVTYEGSLRMYMVCLSLPWKSRRLFNFDSYMCAVKVEECQICSGERCARLHEESESSPPSVNSWPWDRAVVPGRRPTSRLRRNTP